MTFFLAASFVVALLSAAVSTWMVRKLAVARGWDGPASPHHVHDGPVPRVGGIAVFGAILFSVAVGIVGFRVISWAGVFAASTILIAAGIVFLVGLYDDFHPIRPRFKLLFEIVAAVILFCAGIRIDRLPLIGPLPYLITLPVTVLVVVGITNAFNLIDGLDGLAAGTATVSAATFLALAVHSGDIVVAWMAAALLGAMAGFLRFNLNPATIFLGDCGSLVIGFLMSTFAVSTVRETRDAHMLAVPMLAIGLPIMDTLLAIVRRYLKRQPIFVPDREHIHHKLLERGHSHRTAVLLLQGMSVLFGGLSVALVVWHAFAPVMLIMCGATAIVVVYLGYHRSLRWSRTAPRAVAVGSVVAIPSNFQGATSRLKQVQTFPELWRTLDSVLSSGRFSGYALAIPAPQAGVDLRDWGFLLDDTEMCYMWHRHRGNGNGNVNSQAKSNGNGRVARANGNGHGADGGNGHRKNGHAGNGMAVCIIVKLPARKKKTGNVLTVYLSKPTAATEQFLPAGFSGALSEAVARVLSAARHQYGPDSPAFDSRSLAAFRAEQPFGSAD